MLEFRRKIVHLIFGIFLLVLIYFDLMNVIIFGGIIVGFLFLSLLVKYKIIFFEIWKKLDREEDMEFLPGKGSLFFLIGSFLVFMLFSKDIALAAIAILTFGDAVGSLLGGYGKIVYVFNTKKNVDGLFSGWIVAFIAAVFFVAPIEAFLASFLGMAIESIEFFVDDNITIPLVSGFVIWIMGLLL